MVPNNDTAAIKRKMQSIWKESLDQINVVWVLCEGAALGFTRSPEVEAKISPRQDGQASVAVIMVLNKRSWPSLRVIYKLIMKLWDDIRNFEIMRLWMIFNKYIMRWWFTTLEYHLIITATVIMMWILSRQTLCSFLPYPTVVNVVRT